MTLTVPIAGIDTYLLRNISFQLNNTSNISNNNLNNNLFSINTPFPININHFNPSLSNNTNNNSNNIHNILLILISLLQRSINLINKQLKIIYNEIEYWRIVSEANKYEKHINNLFCQGPIHFLSILRLYFFDNIIIGEDNTVDLRLSILKNKFKNLILLLNSFYCIGSDIRFIIEEYDHIVFELQEGSKFSLTTDDSYTLEELSSEKYLQFIRLCKEKIHHGLIHLISTFGNDTFPRETNDEKDPLNHQYFQNYPHSNSNNQLKLSINELAELAEKCVIEAEVLLYLLYLLHYYIFNFLIF